MKYPVELKYLSIFGSALLMCVLILVLCINNYQPALFQKLLVSCNELYLSSIDNVYILATVFAIVLTALLTSLALKLLFSCYKTNLSFQRITNHTQYHFPKRLEKICQKLQLSKEIFIITTHSKPLAITAGFFSLK